MQIMASSASTLLAFHSSAGARRLIELFRTSELTKREEIRPERRKTIGTNRSFVRSLVASRPTADSIDQTTYVMLAPLVVSSA